MDQMRSGGRNVKRGLGGKYAVQVATAAAAAALHSRQSPSNGAPSAAAAGQQLPTSGGSRSEAARTPSGQTSQPAQPPPGGARQQLNGRMGVSAAQQAARQVVPSSSAPSSQSVPQSPPPLVYPAGGGSHGSIAGNGMMAVPTSSAPAAVINGVPSYRNAAMGQVAEGAPPASGVAPPPPPPVPLSPTSSISGKEHPHQADAGEAPYQHIMMHQQLHPPASASLAGHFATPPVNNKVSRASALAPVAQTMPTRTPYPSTKNTAYDTSNPEGHPEAPAAPLTAIHGPSQATVSHRCVNLSLMCVVAVVTCRNIQ